MRRNPHPRPEHSDSPLGFLPNIHGSFRSLRFVRCDGIDSSCRNDDAGEPASTFDPVFNTGVQTLALGAPGARLCPRARMGVAMLNQRDMRESNALVQAKEFAVVKRSVVVDGHKTSVSLEDAFWVSLREIATKRGVSLSMQIASIDQHRKTNNLSSAIRLFVLDYFRSRSVSAMFIGERRTAPSIVPALRD